MQHPHIGMALLKNVAEDLQEDAMLDKAPGFEGRFLSMILSPSAALKKQIENKELESAKA
jgi:translation initiation factor IF-3